MLKKTDTNRGTGRTTAMILRAVADAIDGKLVAVVGRDVYHAKDHALHAKAVAEMNYMPCETVGASPANRHVAHVSVGRRGGVIRTFIDGRATETITRGGVFDAIYTDHSVGETR